MTQFEVLTAAAFVAFAEGGVDAAVVEAGLGGSRDATNVIGARVCVLTGVGLDHTEHLGTTRESIAGEKLAVVRPGAVVVLGEAEWEGMARARGASRVVVAEGNLGCAVAAAEVFLGHPLDPAPAAAVTLPGRLETVAAAPLEIWDGAHNVEGVRYLLANLPGLPPPTVLVASILRDKQPEAMLELLSSIASTLVATQSTSSRTLAAEELAAIGRRSHFGRVEAVADAVSACARARDLAGEDGSVVIAGSLYLLLDLAAVRRLRVR